MKLLRLLLPLVIGLAAAAVLAWGAGATEASGVVTTCNDAGLSTALSGGGLVTFACGPATLTVTSYKTIASDTTIDGSNGGQPLTLTAASGVRLFYVNSGKTLTLTNVLMAGVNNSTGGVFSLGALVISNSQFISNTSGAIYANGPLTVTNSIFRANAGYYAILAAGSGPASISNSQFISNTSGGLETKVSATVSNSQFYSNTIGAAGTGAGLFAEAYGSPLTLTVTSSQFLTNSAYYGGGLGADGGVVTISNTVFVNNSVTQPGGGLWYQTLNPGDGLQILNSTFRNNYGGGVSVNGGSAAPMLVANTLFQDNIAPASPGGLGAGDMAITIAQSSFINNSSLASSLGGMSAGGPAYITGSLFLSNTGQFAGGLALTNAGLRIFTDTVANTSFLSNTAQTFNGGGISALVPLILSDAVISGNVANGSFIDGGGLSWQSPGNNLSISRSLFYNNRAANSSYGGAMYLQGNATIVNSTIYSNSASTTGGIHLANSSSLTLTNDTIASNTGTVQYGNLFGGSITPITLVNTIVAGGSTKNCGGTILSLGHNLSSDATCPLTATGDLSGTNPLLGAFQDNGGASFTLMPSAYSPAINAGDNTRCPADDQRGVARPVGANCDIGAVETTFLKASQTITFNPLADQNINMPPFGISATASSGLPVSFSSLTVSACTVSGSSVTLVAVGTCTLRASQAGNTNFFAAPDVDQGFTVTTTKQAQSVTFNPLPDLALGMTPFNISANASSGLPVSFSSLTTGVCTVSGMAVTLLTGGTCTLRASQAGNASYLAAPNVDRSFTVLLTQTINFGPLANQSVSAAPFNLSASATSGLAVSFGSLTPAVCSVSGSTVTLVSGGTCTMRASQAGNASYAAAPNVDQSFLVFGHVLFLPLATR